ncbi:MAG TPA: hemerythrin domain-containing protein [Planctomycetaceae bacterium]|nr:hemerythrin domain-containing protein [Planctomycetaceae bacterium]
MSTESRSLNSLQALLKEHQEIARRIAELRQWWSELDSLGIRKFGEMAFRVQELRDLLAEHFAGEERDGYLRAALAVAPQFTRPAATLREEHAQFLERLDQQIARLQQCEPESGYWRESRDEIEQLVAALRQHEQSENAIVQAAFEDDLGTKD